MALNIKASPKKTSEEALLPTGGFSYGDAIPGGRVLVQAFNWQSERILFESGSQEESIHKRHLRYVEVLKQICVDLKMDPWNLMSGDAMYLILKARSISYGATYELDVKCPQCGTSEKISLRVPEDMPANRYPTTFPGLIDYETVEGNKVQMRFLTLRNELDAENSVRNKLTTKLIQESEFEAELTNQKLASHVVSVNGQKVESVEDVLTWFKTNSLERDEIRDFLHTVEPGVSNRIPIKCANCEHEYHRTIFMGPSFFRPGRRANVRGLPPGVRIGVFGADPRSEAAPGS
jgi:hypothetical protein